MRWLAGALVALVLAAGSLLVTATPTEAQLPPTEEQAQAVERELLCPICTNERLDVCPLEICKDMKRIIREQLAAGSSPEEIILYFETRYGEKVRADLPAEGFNLWLYGWIVASVLAVGAAGAWSLVRLQRRGRRLAASAGADDAWLDEQIAEPPSR